MATRKGLDPETTKKLVLARVKEWDTAMAGVEFFDVKELVGNDQEPAEILARSPEAGLDHG